jgi:hypothetical protein
VARPLPPSHQLAIWGTTLIRFRNGLTKPGGISINGVFQHLEVFLKQNVHGVPSKSAQRLSFSETLLHKT